MNHSLLAWIKNVEEHAQIAQYRQLHRLLQEPFLSLAVRHLTNIIKSYIGSKEVAVLALILTNYLSNLMVIDLFDDLDSLLAHFCQTNLITKYVIMA